MIDSLVLARSVLSYTRYSVFEQNPGVFYTSVWPFRQVRTPQSHSGPRASEQGGLDPSYFLPQSCGLLKSRTRTWRMLISHRAQDHYKLSGTCPYVSFAYLNPNCHVNLFENVCNKANFSG